MQVLGPTDASLSQVSSQYLLVSTSVCLFALYLFFQVKNKYYYWDRLGIKGDRYLPLSSYFNYLFKRDVISSEAEKRRKYGKVYGTYLMGLPRLFIGDPEVIKQICIKDFDVFPDHTGISIHNKYHKNALLWLTGTRWKKVRAIMSPTFTSGNIRRMFRFMNICADDLLLSMKENLSKDSAEPTIMDPRELFSMFSLNGFATCCYSLKLARETVHSQDATSSELQTPITRDEFLRLTKLLTTFSRFREMLFMITPEFILRAIKFTAGPEEKWEPMAQFISRLIKKRSSAQGSRKFDDLLQLLIDARLDDKLELDDLDQAENHHAGLTRDLLHADQERLVAAAKASGEADVNEPRLTRLTELEIVSEAMLLLAAGLETTSSLLTSCVYSLAHHTDVQQRLYDEVRKIAKTNPANNSHVFQYEDLTACVYLDAVISETLRMLPPFILTDRKAKHDYHIKKYNVTVPKGTSIVFGLKSIQNDPDYWDQPDKFNPDRFMPENRDKIVSGAYMPFSMGPRHCIGMRFSLTESKLALAKVIMSFSFRPVPGLPFPPEPVPSPAIVILRKPLVIVETR